MFRLQLPTDPRWVELAEQNTEEILTDHAWCEQKAASMAISMIVQFHDYPQLVKQMLALAKEEMEHFERVYAFIVQRGYALGKERKDAYVNDLMLLMKKGNSRENNLVDKLLIAALIEARSCERFKLLSETIKDAELAAFYRELMESEAGHYTLFITLAREIAPRKKVDKRWQEILAYEAEIILKYGKNESIHG